MTAPLSGEFLTGDNDESLLDQALQYTVVVTGTRVVLQVIFSGSIWVGFRCCNSGPDDSLTDTWSWAVTIPNGEHSLTASTTDYCGNVRNIVHPVVAYTNLPDMTLSSGFPELAFDETTARRRGVTGGSDSGDYREHSSRPRCASGT